MEWACVCMWTCDIVIGTQRQGRRRVYANALMRTNVLRSKITPLVICLLRKGDKRYWLRCQAVSVFVKPPAHIQCPYEFFTAFSGTMTPGWDRGRRSKHHDCVTVRIDVYTSPPSGVIYCWHGRWEACHVRVTGRPGMLWTPIAKVFSTKCYQVVAIPFALPVRLTISPRCKCVICMTVIDYVMYHLTGASLRRRWLCLWIVLMSFGHTLCISQLPFAQNLALFVWHTKFSPFDDSRSGWCTYLGNISFAWNSSWTLQCDELLRTQLGQYLNQLRLPRTVWIMHTLIFERGEDLFLTNAADSLLGGLNRLVHCIVHVVPTIFSVIVPTFRCCRLAHIWSLIFHNTRKPLVLFIPVDTQTVPNLHAIVRCGYRSMWRGITVFVMHNLYMIVELADACPHGFTVIPRETDPFSYSKIPSEYDASWWDRVNEGGRGWGWRWVGQIEQGSGWRWPPAYGPVDGYSLYRQDLILTPLNCVPFGNKIFLSGSWLTWRWINPLILASTRDFWVRPADMIAKPVLFVTRQHSRIQLIPAVSHMHSPWPGSLCPCAITLMLPPSPPVGSDYEVRALHIKLVILIKGHWIYHMYIQFYVWTHVGYTKMIIRT